MDVSMQMLSAAPGSDRCVCKQNTDRADDRASAHQTTCHSRMPQIPKCNILPAHNDKSHQTSVKRSTWLLVKTLTQQIGQPKHDKLFSTAFKGYVALSHLQRLQRFPNGKYQMPQHPAARLSPWPSGYTCFVKTVLSKWADPASGKIPAGLVTQTSKY